MSHKSILIAGAGIGGLSAGCYAQMNGYDVRILEMHDMPDGMCTAWQRNGYTFDGCIHNLAGSCSESSFHEIWQELGVVPNVAMKAYDEIVQAERPDGAPLTIHTDLGRLAAHMKELAPADAKVIDELVEAARVFTRFDIMGLSNASLFERLKTVRFAPSVIRYGGTTMEQFAKRFSDPFLRRVFPTLLYDWPQQPILMFLTFLGRSHIGNLAWPAGGSANFTHTIEKRFQQLGGKIEYEAQVTSILIGDDRAVGVRLADGTERRADIIISNA
jgi:phytoene dehydrogenase-like protein